MPRVQVDVEISAEHYRHLESEARRAGVSVRNLVQRFTQQLVTEEEERQRSDDDHPIFVC